jgi:Holliday junction resolvase RusA-like endonuclease
MRSRRRALTSKPKEVTHFLALEPVPTARPRVGRWGTYYPPTTKAWKEKADELLPSIPFVFDGLVKVVLVFNCTKPRTGKLRTPRGDVDNYAKGMLDAITKKGWWTDDTLVQELQVAKHYNTPPGVHILIREVDGIQTAG